MHLCLYRDVLGAARTGVHAWRLPGVDLAIVDVLLTLLAAVAIAHTTRGPNTEKESPHDHLVRNSLICFLVLWIVGTGLHALFCVPSPVVSSLAYALGLHTGHDH